ncbi:MAG TPA: uroporphyrinogen decarboxylase family protein [Bacteroidales bacterium]|nr:uroporphyrinogen decarboxylase family protein [Bacteroidales bacterium]
MTDLQWNNLLKAVNGETVEPLPAGFIIDSPWLPNWFGIRILDYFSNDDLWLQANFKAIETFPELMFLPGFWSEYGMCTEPSAFGAKCIFWENEFPFAEKTIHTTDDIQRIKLPDPATDGMLPFMLNRLVTSRKLIESRGHQIRFSVSRGPLNIASFLMGTTELMTAMMMEPDAVHALLRIITDFLKSWHRLQRRAISSIDGILMLDDIVGFVGETEFLEFGYPYLKELYDENVSVKFFHNDADFTMSVKHYPDLGINLFNPGVQMTVQEIIDVTQSRMTVLGNIPPRDVLASGTEEQITKAVSELLKGTSVKNRLIASCGGGMPPAVSTGNIRSFIKALQ